MRKTTLAIVIALGFGIFACGQLKSQRDLINSENDAETQARYNDLKDAEGIYKGTVIFDGTDLPLAATLELKRTFVIEPDSRAQNNMEDRERPVLQGNVSIPALLKTSATYSRFQEVYKPMGNLKRLVFTSVDYKKNTGDIVLNYVVQGNRHGHLIGNLNGDVFEPEWYFESLSRIGKFSLKKVSNIPGSSGGAGPLQ